MPTPSTSRSATCPPPGVPSSTSISAVAATARGSLTSTATSAGLSRASPRTRSRQPAWKTGPWPQWSLRWPGSEPKHIAAPDTADPLATRVYPAPGRHLPAASPRPSPRPRSRRSPGSTHRPGGHRPRSGRKPGRWSPPAAVATSLSPPRRCRCCRCRHHCRRHRGSAQPWRGPDHPSASHSCDPAACHRRGQGEWLRSSHRAGDGPPGRLRELERAKPSKQPRRNN